MKQISEELCFLTMHKSSTTMQIWSIF